MFDAIKPLVDSGIINEETKTAISEAWDTKLNEAREQLRAEIREEFAGRYEHDKSVMVEALDKMVTESLQAEIREFAEEKSQLAADRVRFNKRMQESAGKFDRFLVGKLAEEIKELRGDRLTQKESIQRLEKFVIRALAEEIQELRKDRKVQGESIERLEQFVIKALAEEIKEFSQDKQAVVETKVRLVASAKEKLAELQSKFVKRSAALVQETVTSNLKNELTQLKEDIQTARENMFGRRIFEAFAGEFSVTHLNENKEIRKLQDKINEQADLLEAAQQVVDQKEKIVESKERELRVIKETTDRKERLAEMLKPLNNEKATVMRELLENVQTDKLQSAFEKYLPAVLNNSVVKQSEKAVLNEARVEITGDKSAKVTAKADDTNVIELKRLAGL